MNDARDVALDLIMSSIKSQPLLCKICSLNRFLYNYGNRSSINSIRFYYLRKSFTKWKICKRPKKNKVNSFHRRLHHSDDPLPIFISLT